MPGDRWRAASPLSKTERGRQAASRLTPSTGPRSAGCGCACRWRRRSRCTAPARTAARRVRRRRWAARRSRARRCGCWCRRGASSIRATVIVVEIGLLDPPVLECDLAEQREAHCPSPPRPPSASADALRIDGEAAVDGRVDARDGRSLPLLVDRHLDHGRHVADEAAVRRRCRGRAPRQLAPPAGLLRRQLDDLGEPPGIDRVIRRSVRRSSTASRSIWLPTSMIRAGPISSSSKSFGSLPVACASSADERLHRRRRAGCWRPSGTSRCGYAPPPCRSRSACSGCRTAGRPAPMPSSSTRSWGLPSVAKVETMLSAPRCGGASHDLAVGVEPGLDALEPRRCGRSRAGCRPRASTAPAPARRHGLATATPLRARSRTSTCGRSRRRAASSAR